MEEGGGSNICIICTTYPFLLNQLHAVDRIFRLYTYVYAAPYYIEKLV